MSKSDVSFAAAVESRTRGIYVELLRGNPALTLGEIQQLCRGEFGKVLSAITLGELTVETKATKRESAPVATPRKSTKKGGTKTPTKAAKPKPTTAKSKPAAPKTPADAGRLSWSGKARGTRYQVA